MLKFFRKIRQSLLSTGQTSRYFKYAIGEIVLVVVGILIALSINNWNNDRQRKISERTYIERLIEDLNNDSKYFERRITRNSEKLESIQKQVDTFLLIQNKSSLDYVIENMEESLSELIVNRKTYDEMVSTGVLFSIEDKAVLTEIQTYYNWSELNQYYIKTNNNDLANHWQKSFYKLLSITDYFEKQGNSYSHLNLSTFYDNSHENNIDLRAYLLKYQQISEIKLDIFKDQSEYCLKLIETLKKELNQ